MRVVHDDTAAKWVAERLGFDGFGDCTAFAVRSDRVWPTTYEILAGVVYHDYQPTFGTIQVSMAAENPMWCRVVWELLAYPFDQLKVNKVRAAVKHDNEHGIRTFKHIGFRQEAVLAHEFGWRRHGVILRMLRPEYERSRHGQTRTQPAAAA